MWFGEVGGLPAVDLVRMSRWAIGLLLIAACGGAAVQTTLPTASAAELAAFCSRYQEVENMGRQETLLALAEVAPREIAGPIERAAALGGTVEDDERIDDYLARCNEAN